MENKVALITGASGGIGEAFGHVLAADGHDLVLVARRDQELHRVKGVITSKHPVSVHVIALDLNEAGAVDALVAEMRPQPGSGHCHQQCGLWPRRPFGGTPAERAIANG